MDELLKYIKSLVTIDFLRYEQEIKDLKYNTDFNDQEKEIIGRYLQNRRALSDKAYHNPEITIQDVS